MKEINTKRKTGRMYIAGNLLKVLKLLQDLENIQFNIASKAIKVCYITNTYAVIFRKIHKFSLTKKLVSNKIDQKPIDH